MRRSLIGAVTAAAVACASVGALMWRDGQATTLALPPEPAAASPTIAVAPEPTVVARRGPRDAALLDGDPAIQGFDPFSAPTPEVAQGQTPSVVPLPVAPASIATSEVAKVGTAKPDALLSLPLTGRKTSRFGVRFHPVLHIWKLHTGLDLAAPCGTPVGAARAGTVVRTGWAGGNGVQVKIDHGMIGGHRIVTTYNHLSSIGVKVGQQVEALDGVGRVGSTGYSTGCHLHFEVIADGQFTDPEPWLDGTPTVVDLSKMIAESPIPGLSPSPSPTPSASDPASGSPSGSPSESPSGSPSDGSPSGTAPPESPSPSPEPGDSASPTETGTPDGSPSAPGSSPPPGPPSTSAPASSSAPESRDTAPESAPAQTQTEAARSAGVGTETAAQEK